MTRSRGGEGTRFVEIPADRLLEELRSIGAAIAARGGALLEGAQGREVTIDLVPPGGRVIVRVYTSIATGAGSLRGCGEDAIRIVLLAPTPEGDRAVSESDRVFRTAPREGDRVALFLERLRSRLREAYRRALAIPSCPDCGRAMQQRKGARGMFWGCLGFPTCRGTRPMVYAEPRR